MSVETGNINYEYMNEVDKHLICSLCENPLINPVSTNCETASHTFCRDCIEKRIKTDPLCPKCDQKLSIQDLTPIRMDIFIDMLNDLLVKCAACKETGLKRKDFDAHYNEKCPKAKVQCPSLDGMCLWTGTQDQLEEHLKTCIINLIKPLFNEVRIYNKEFQDKIIENERLKEEIKLRDTVHKQRTPIIGPMKADQTLTAKLNHQQTQVSGPIKVVEQQLTNKIILQLLQPLTATFNQQKAQIELFTIDKKQLNDALNQLQTEVATLENKNRQLTNQLEQQEKRNTENLQMLQGYIDQQEYSYNYDRYTATGISGSINNAAYYPLLNTVHNLPPPHPPPYCSLVFSANGYPANGNSSNTPLFNNVNNNPSGNVTQDTLNRRTIESCIIPISIPISVNTNIAGGNNNNADRSNNNIAGGSHNNICSGNINVGGGNNNNTAGGSHNNITGGKNNGSAINNAGRINNPAAVNNSTGNNNGSAINNTDRINNPAAINNSTGNNTGSAINNTDRINNPAAVNNNAGGINHASGGGNNIAGGNDNNITSDNYNSGTNSNNNAGGCNNSIAVGDNSFVENDNHNRRNGFNDAINGNNTENDNHNRRNGFPNASNGDNTENNTNDCITDPFEDLGSDTSSDIHRIRENPDIVHPPNNDS